MTDIATEPSVAKDQVIDADAASDDTTDELLDDEMLVEEISIDGMCGVY